MIGIAVNSVNAQSLYREYSDDNVYMYIDNSTQRYWTGGPQLPHHQLVITNVGNSTISVRVLIRVVLRNGNNQYLKEITREETVSLAPGRTDTKTIWMSTANKGNAYYCVEGFRVLGVTPQQAGSKARKYAMSERGKGYYIVNTDFAYIYNRNVLGDWLPPKEGYVRGTKIYVYGTLVSNPQLAVIEVSKWVGGDTYMRMSDLIKANE